MKLCLIIEALKTEKWIAHGLLLASKSGTTSCHPSLIGQNQPSTGLWSYDEAWNGKNINFQLTTLYQIQFKSVFLTISLCRQTLPDIPMCISKNLSLHANWINAEGWSKLFTGFFSLAEGSWLQSQTFLIIRTTWLISFQCL